MSTTHTPSFWTHYVFSTDHKMIGKQYYFTAMFMALFATAWSLLLRVHLAWPGRTWPLFGKLFPGLFQDGVLLPERYLSLVTMHGTVMIFFVVSIALVSGFGNFIIPLQIGARDMAYPFLNMLSYWTIVPACLLMLGSFFAPDGAAASGWTAYPPLSAIAEASPGSGMGQTLWLLAMALFIASFTMGGLNFVTTILNLRTRGMSMMRMPLMIWTLFVASVLGILAFPALTAAAIMLLLDRLGSTSFFLPAGLVFGGTVLPHSGGTPLLFQHLFWFLGHPEVYVLVLPALGIAFEVIAVFGRRPVFGYRTSVWALLVIAVLSMIVWGHHMFVSGMSPYVGEYFSVATVTITAPFAILAMNLIATLWRAEIRFNPALLFVLGIIAAVGIGGLGGIFLATATSDMYLHNSYFVVGHFHLMIAVVTMFAIFAGTYHWFPKTVRAGDERDPRQGALLVDRAHGHRRLRRDAPARRRRRAAAPVRSDGLRVPEAAAVAERADHPGAGRCGRRSARVPRELLPQPVLRRARRRQSVGGDHAGVDHGIARTARELGARSADGPPPAI